MSVDTSTAAVNALFAHGETAARRAVVSAVLAERDAERLRAEAAESEVARLRAQVAAVERLGLVFIEKNGFVAVRFAPIPRIVTGS